MLINFEKLKNQIIDMENYESFYRVWTQRLDAAGKPYLKGLHKTTIG